MKLRGLLVAILVGSNVVAAAQEQKKAKPAAKKAAPKVHAAHAKATPEQIRRFNEMQKKQDRAEDAKKQAPKKQEPKP